MNQKDLLHNASAIDPRFKSLPFLNEEERENTFSRLKAEAILYREEESSNVRRPVEIIRLHDHEGFFIFKLATSPAERVK